MIVFTNYFAVQDLTGLVAVGPPAGKLNGAKMGLYKTQIVPSRDTTLSDLTPCDFAGYALSAAITWDVPFLDVNDVATVLGSMVSFVAGSTPPLNPQSVYGYYIVDAAGTDLLALEAFDAPRGISAPGNTIAIVPQVQAVSQTG